MFYRLLGAREEGRNGPCQCAPDDELPTGIIYLRTRAEVSSMHHALNGARSGETEEVGKKQVSDIMNALGDPRDEVKGPQN